MKTKQLALDAMLSAMCAVLGYVAIDFGNLKISFESLPILLGALLFGPADGAVIGALGTLLYQLLRYGVSVTTPLWILPYVLCGLVLGLVARAWKGKETGKQLALGVALAELTVTAFNTLALVVDGLVYGYFTPAFIYGALALRLAICAGKAVVFSLLLPPLVRAVRQKIL